MRSAILESLEIIGASTISFFRYIGGLAILLLESFYWMSQGAIFRFNLVINQAAFLGVNSTSIVIITTAFTGMVISLQLANVAVQYGAAKMVGFGVAVAMARELAPMITAVTVAGRAGSAITAELGSMKVTEQIDAMEAMAVSPVKYLIVPRILACGFTLPMLTLFAMLAGIIGGAFVAKLIAGIQYNVYFNSISDLMKMKDVYKGLIKSIIFAVEIAIISCYQGISTEGGAAGVGKSTTGSVVYSILIVFITNFLLSAIMFPHGGKGLW